MQGRSGQKEGCPFAGRERRGLDRRRFLGYFSAAGLSATLLPGALAAVARDAEKITPGMIAEAEKIAGLSFSEEERKRMARGLETFRKDFERIRGLSIGNDTPPALYFDPVPPGKAAAGKGVGTSAGGRAASSPGAREGAGKKGAPDDSRESSAKAPPGKQQRAPSGISSGIPGKAEDLAFLPVARLAALIAERKVSSSELTETYLARLKKYDPLLHCVVTLTEERALEQARQADREIAAGRYRGPLHGIPWGVKDLFSVKGYRTTWGAKPYEDQVIDEDAAVVSRLDAAGAVLMAKLSCGALAMGDVWFGGKTRNPWKTDQGSSGSSAGPAAAVVAGLVGFAIGTETRGSIISPSRRCGASGLRPTFGRVSRHGCMTLSFTMDKVGPLCRTVEDCALVFGAIQGADARDLAARDRPFSWNPAGSVSGLRVGYPGALLEEGGRGGRLPAEYRKVYAGALETLRGLGVVLVPKEWPDFPSRSLDFILATEAAASFDDLTRSKRDRLLTSNAWGEIFREHRFVPAVEYIQAGRARTLLIGEMNRFFEDIDVCLGSRLGATNLTGHPEVSIPCGFREDGTPYGLSFTGALYGEETLLLLAHRFQEATGWHGKHPVLPEPGR